MKIKLKLNSLPQSLIIEFIDGSKYSISIYADGVFYFGAMIAPKAIMALIFPCSSTTPLPSKNVSTLN